jgi:soluble lytic murein transglycosylase-like protein
MIFKHAAHLGAMFLSLSLAAPTWAQEDQTGPGLRRVAVPAPNHTGRRITIQITPEEHLRNTTPPAAPTVPLRIMPSVDAPPVASGGNTAWFWSAISPSLPADPGRFWAAQDVLASAPEAAALSVPRLITLQGIVDRHAPAILRASLETQVSPALILAVMAVESAGRVDAVSRAGAQGLMQLIPATAERFGVSDPFDPDQNIAGGTAYLEWLLKEFGGDAVLALAGYNAGEGAVRRAGGVPDFRETRDYVPKVLAAWMIARRLCRTPPDLISDGCVFTPIAVN